MPQRNDNATWTPKSPGSFRRWQAYGLLGRVQILPERPHKRRPMKPRSGK